MIKFADVQKHAEGAISVHIDDSTPAGHFAVIAKVFGYVTDYLFEGEKGDPEAVVKGFSYISTGLSAPSGYARITPSQMLYAELPKVG